MREPKEHRPDRIRISRRAVLRGAGVTMALPWLESLPALGAAPSTARTAAGFPKRFAVVFMGNGINGNQVGFQGFNLTAKNTLVLNTATVPGANGVGGAVTVAHDGRYGDLSGKTVALEPATGFSFDSPMLPRVH